MSGMIVVVSALSDAAGISDGTVLRADAYLQGEDDSAARGATVVNLCRSYRYRTKGYYVSLLADARGQQAIPSVETIEGLADSFGVFRTLEEAGIATVGTVGLRARPRALPEAIPPDREENTPVLRAVGGAGEDGPRYRPAQEAEVAETLAFFGECADRRFAAAARMAYREWPTPVLRLQWVWEEEEWKVAGLAPVPLHQLGGEDRARVLAAVGDERKLRRTALVRREEKRASIAVLVDREHPFSPSTPETIDRFERVAKRMNVHVHRLELDEIARLGEYDALFIRAITGVREPAFQWALRAEALDMPTIDDTQSIIRCSNKVFLHELLGREGIPTPRTLVATAKTPWEQLVALGLPLVIKLPDGSFSAAVHRIESPEEFRSRATEMFRRSPLIIAQEYLPTPFDWRITVLGRRLLFAARYHMASGHWQIRSDDVRGVRYGRVQAVARSQAPPEIVALALRTAVLIGDGLYGVDIKETPTGPVVIEVNDNPNLDVGYEDAADGEIIYRNLIDHFLRRIEEAPEPAGVVQGAGEGGAAPLRAPIRAPAVQRTERPFRPFEVAGIELEYPTVDRDLNLVSRVEDTFRVLAGRPTSDIDLGAVTFSNEIADHVFEIKTTEPVRSLSVAEEVLVEGVRRFAATLRERFDARLLPTGMHPWMDPRRGRLWTRSDARIYGTYARLFDVYTHGWMNVHAAHLSLPLGREEEAIALHNAAALLLPYLPALAASSPMYDGELQAATDNRLAWILEHQARIPESCGDIIPEYTAGFADYRKRVLAPMYAALDRFPDSRPIRQEFFNARGATLRFGSRRMEIRVLDTQECVKLDVAIAVFVRSALRSLTQRVASGRLLLPDHAVLVDDFHTTVREGGRAWVTAPHLAAAGQRREDGRMCVGEVLRELLDHARKTVRKDEAPYLDLVQRIIATGSLSERIHAALLPHVDDDEGFTEAARRIYIELADCLELNEPWAGRGL